MVRRRSKAVKTNNEIDLVEEKRSILTNISTYLHGLDDVKSLLEKRFQVMINERSGSSVTFLGPPGTGKRSLLSRLSEQYQGEVEFLEHNANFDDLVAVKERIHDLEDLLDKNKNVCYVIYNFEKFRGNFGNNVLYTMAQNVRKSPLVLILVGEGQSGMSMFEKRIASRLSSNVVRSVPLHKPEECWQMFRRMIEVAIVECSVNTRASLKLPEDIPYDFHRICRKTPVYGQLKLMAKQYVDESFCSKFAEIQQDLIERLIKSRVQINPYSNITENLTDRMYGILLAGAIVTPKVSCFFSIRQVYQAYLRFINERDIKCSDLILEDDRGPNKENRPVATCPPIFEADVMQLIFYKFFTAKYQGRRIISLCWNLDPLPLFDTTIMKNFRDEFAYYLNDTTDLRNLM